MYLFYVFTIVAVSIEYKDEVLSVSFLISKRRICIIEWILISIMRFAFGRCDSSKTCKDLQDLILPDTWPD